MSMALHLRVDGPVVHQMQETFALDWCFATGELLEAHPWYAVTEHRGDVLARVVTDGPDEELERLQQVILGAISCAEERVSIITP